MESDVNMDRRTWTTNISPKGYALTGKIMLAAIVILLAMILVMVGLHIYARWYILRVRRQQLYRRRRNTGFVFYVENLNNPLSPGALGIVNNGLDTSILTSLPVFVYTSKSHPELLDCAVCLSEFEDNEKGRLLPKCNHSFHIDCIDMWFHSHSTCPLCRSTVETEIVPTQTTPNNGSSDVVVSLWEPESNEPGSSSGLCVTCPHQEENGASTSMNIERKGSDVDPLTIEVPRRNESENEFAINSSAIQGFRSPGTRLLSFKRILSMNRSGTPTPTACGSQSIETDIECGSDELTQKVLPR